MEIERLLIGAYFHWTCITVTSQVMATWMLFQQPTFRERWAVSSPYKGPEMGTFPIHGGIMISVSCERERPNRYIFILEIDYVD